MSDQGYPKRIRVKNATGVPTGPAHDARATSRGFVTRCGRWISGDTEELHMGRISEAMANVETCRVCEDS